MKTPFLFAAVIAAGLASAAFVPAANAKVHASQSAPTCETANDVGCNMPATAFSAMSSRPLAVPHFARRGESNWCDNITSGGSGMPAYLYSRCE